MNEDAARDWVRERFGDTAISTLEKLVAAVVAGNDRRNLISATTIDSIWQRHILDSAQLVPWGGRQGTWLDIGTGAGFPGLVAAILRPQRTVLVEPRRQRVAFLDHCIASLGITNAKVIQAKVETLAIASTVISARAVASIEKLLQAGAHCGTKETRWLLPRGRFDDADLRNLRRNWGGLFHMKQSLSDPGSTILICDGPYRR